MRIISPCFFTAFFFFFISGASAQSCFNVNAGKDTTISCLNSCFNLKAKVPDVRSSEDYQVIPIAYEPFPYTNSTGVEFNSTYLDDRYSDEIILPFTFCFYGRRYSSCVVGTNGLVTFDVATNKNTYNAYLLNNPIPFAGGVPNDGGVAYYPRASIMGPFHDIDPDPATTAQQPKRKMEYIIVGTAPCRKFVLNFYRIPYFFCPKEIVSQQMVLYEGTGIIDIFIESKPISCAASSNNGRAILGVQNWERTEAVAVPGRNNTVWAANKEGWRFVPNGFTSLLNRVELYKNNVKIATGTTVNLGNGELEATFPNTCQPEDSMSYLIKAIYNKCDNSLVETEGSDTMIVYKTPVALTPSAIHPACAGDNGTITITSPVGPDIQYSIDGGITWQASTVFIKPAGNYTITARGSGAITCTPSANVVLTAPATLTAAANNAVSTCSGNDGQITVSATGGTTAYAFSIDNGISYQNSNVFLTNPGTYFIKVKDAHGCMSTTTATTTLNDQMFLNLGADTTVCAGSAVILQPNTNAETSIFQWTPATGLSSDITKNPAATPVDTIRYVLNAQWGVCSRTDDIQVNVLRKPVAFAGNDSIICYRNKAFLNGIATNLSGPVSYRWSPVASVLKPTSAITTATAANTQLYTLTVKDDYGCNFTVSDQVLITVRPAINADAGNDTNAMYGMPHLLLGKGTGNSFTWSPPTGLNNPFTQKPLATLYNDTRFSLRVSNDIGCSETDDVFIKVYKGPTYYLPNAFTPNADGLNDIFTPTPVGIAATDYFSVFDRFGNLVFKTNRWMQGWDGMYKGKKADAGTYTWMIKGTDYSGRPVAMNGTVILIR